MMRGRRLMLSESYTDQLLRRQELPPGERGWLRRRLSGEVESLLPLLYVPYFRSHRATSFRGVKSCNLGLWRRDFEKVNGFDETYVGWGREDHDLAVRLLRSGIKRKEGRPDVVVVHLWHKKSDRTGAHENWLRLQHVLSADYTWAPVGLKK
jgi:GT2 family glycosyltransferase